MIILPQLLRLPIFLCEEANNATQKVFYSRSDVIVHS